MTTWSYTTSGRRDAAIAHVKALTAEQCRTSPPPRPPTIMRDATPAEAKAQTDAFAKAHADDETLWREAAAVFERTTKFVLETLATYTEDAKVGVLVRLHLSPVGPPASEELFVSISEHLPSE